MIGTSKSVWGFDPRTIPGCQLWLDGSDQSSMTLSGSSITQLRDKSGNGNHMVNNGTSPLYNSSLINSVGGIDCTNGGALISSGIQNSANISFAMVAVVKSGITNWGSFFTHGDRDYDFAVERQENTSSINFQTANDNSSCIITFTLDAPVLYFGTMTSGTSRFFESFSGGVNTIVTGTNSSTISLGSKIIRVGKSDNNNEPCNSFIGEIIYYNTVLTTIQRQQIEGYLAHKWGLTGYYDSSIPLSIPGCQLWLDAADASTVSGTTTVTQWRDKSGNARHLGVGSGTTSYSSNAIKLNSSYMFVTSPIDLSKLSVFLVSKSNNIWNQPVFVIRPNTSASYNSTDGLQIAFYDQIINIFSQDLTQYTDSGLINTTLITAQASDRTLTTWLNGTNQKSVTNSSARTSTAQGFAIGAEWANGSYHNPISIASIYEILVYNTALTTTQRQTIERYLMKKWGIGTSSSIPSTHPFYSIRPHLRTFQPIDVPGCALWLDAADASTVTIATGVSQLMDKSGNGYTLTQSTTGNQPSYSSNLITFSNNTYLNIPQAAVNNLSTWSLFFVINPISSSNWIMSKQKDGANTYNVLSMTYNTTTSGVPQTGSNGFLYWRSMNAGTQAVSTAALATSSLQLCNLTYDGTNLYFYKNGELEKTTAGSFTIPNDTSATNYTMGIWIQGGTIINSGVTNFRLGEMLVYNTGLTTSQRQQIEGYLAHKWGLTLYLPVISPLSIPGCAMWFDAADSNTITLSSGSLTQWNDKSGNGRNLTAVSGYANATVSSAFQNGLNVFNFSGNGLYRAAANSAVYPLDAYIIVALKSLTAQSDVLSIGPTNADNFNSLIFSEGTQSRWKNGSSYGVRNFFSTTDETSTGFLLIQWSIANNNYLLRRNGILLAQPSSFTYSLPGGSIFQVGFRHTDITAANFSGYIGEIVVFNSQLGDSQRQQIEGYLARKWGISISATLPSPHPFKSFPPAIAAHFSPTDITGCQLWLDAADSSAVTIATGVSQWNDKSGNSNNLTQSTTGSQPTYASSLVTFASDKYLNIPASVMNNLSTWSLFFVINPISSSNWIITKHKFGVDTYNVLSMTYNTTTGGVPQTGSVGNLYWRSMNAGTQLGSSDSLTTSTLQTCSLTYDGTILYFYKNGELNQATTGSFAIQNQTSPDHYTLGALIYPGGQITNSGVTNFRLGEMISYNTFLTNAQRERVEGYLAHKWGLLSSLSSTHPYRTLPPIFPPIIQYNIIATGGTIVSTVGTTYHVFRISSSFVVRRSVTVNYLVVGGGGGGGDRHGGGGGAGGVLSGNWSASAGTYIITVGAGGQYGSTDEGGQVAYGTPNGSGTKGGDSLLSGTGISITAYGGGGGGSYDGNPSGTVGSGGGGGGQNLSGVAGTAGQGNAGGSGSNPGAGGGGGAGGAGVSANTGTGGIGTSSFSTHLLAVGYGTTFAVPTSPNTVISGGVAYIAGGGGGCAGTSPGPGGSGGLGGGGRGDWADTNITAGTPNTGGGGGGTRSHPDSLQTTGRNGGSGLVLVWY